MEDQSVAEQIYFELYEYVSVEAEYLQGRKLKLLLPEAVVSALAATILAPFLKGFFTDLGKDLATRVSKKLLGHAEPSRKHKSDRRRTRQHDARSPAISILKDADIKDTEQLLKDLAGKLPEMRARQRHLPSAQREICHELVALGLSQDTSERLAVRSIEIVRKHLDSPGPQKKARP